MDYEVTLSEGAVIDLKGGCLIVSRSSNTAYLKKCIAEKKIIGVGGAKNVVFELVDGINILRAANQ